jgi:PAS domain S-box-containing protein
MEWTGLIQEYATITTTISVSIAGIIFVYKKGIKPVLEAIKAYNKTVEKIDRIFEEITPNGGTSIKDKIDYIDYNVTLVQQIQQAMAADTKVAQFRTDSEGNCVWVNRTYRRTVDRDMSEILGHGWQNTIAQDERDEVVTEWYKSVEEEREFSMNFHFETPTGEKILCRCRSYKLVNRKGDVLGYLGYCNIL